MKVLILGRTNVGKSSLFNRLVKRKKALVINEPGITRDLLKGKTEWWGHEFEVIDSGGRPEPNERDELSREILKKIQSALKEADILILTVDGRAGLQQGDRRLMQTARKTGKPLLLFVNKVDQAEKTALLTAPFFEICANPVSGSCERHYGIDELVEWIILQKKTLSCISPRTKPAPPDKPSKPTKPANAPPNKPSKPPKPVNALPNKSAKPPKPANALPNKSVEMAKSLTWNRDRPLEEPPNTKKPVSIEKTQGRPTQLFVVGRANSGKSLFCNRILKAERMIVSSRPGTTLDTVTEFFSYNKRDYAVSDNPGARGGTRKEREKISFAKSRAELENADIALLVTDALVGPVRQDARLVQLCLEKRKPVILLINKTDLLQDSPAERMRDLREEVKKVFHFHQDLPVVFFSAKTGKNKNLIFKKIEDIKQKIRFRIPTSELNRFFMQVIRKAPAPVYGTSDVKFYYISQTAKQPPEFIAFANYPKGVRPAYRRFIINSIKEKWSLQGVPIAFHALPKR